MKVYATTAFPQREFTYLPVFEEFAAKDAFGVHHCVTDAEEADVILFLDGHQHPSDLKLSAIRNHPLAVKYRERTFVYNELDQPWCAMQGLYASMPGPAFDPARQRACSYLTIANSHVLDPAVRRGEPRLLFSFMGRRCHKTRDRLLRSAHPRAHLEDTSELNMFAMSGGDIIAAKRRYAGMLAASKFVLCPRGAGPSSFRLFETMATGRVPVILSDEWVAPEGPDWDACSLRVGERHVDRVPAVLEENEHRFEAMAANARRAWEEWFSPEVLFHRMVESCREIMEGPRVAESVCQQRMNCRYLRLLARELRSRVRSGVGDLPGYLRNLRAAH